MKKKITYMLKFFIICILFLLTFSLVWCIKYFGNIGFNEIVFTLNMPLKGTSDEYFITFFNEVVCPLVLIVLLLFFIGMICRKTKRKTVIYMTVKNKTSKYIMWPLDVKFKVIILLGTIWFLFILLNADKQFSIVDYIKSQLQASEFIKNEYVDPKNVNIVFPEQKRNLICIYIESAESSMQDEENGGLLQYNLITDLTKLAKENVSFSQSDLIEGAAVAPACGWTMSALVAQTSGLPLKLYTYDAKTVDNSMDNYVSFMPGATTLGEILQTEGYHNFFMAGSEFEFGGRKDYFEQHGNYEIWDYNTAIEEGKIDEDYKVKWGFEDQKLYEYAKDKLLDLAKEKQPFNFSMLTVDTHAGGGYICENCPNIYEEKYYNVWACSSNQVYEFVKWIQQQEFYKNTTICITGDHCSMQSNFLTEFEYDKHNGGINRKVYNTYINAVYEPEQMKNRKFTTLDFFPTTLGSMGVKIEGDRLGLGTNLFSNTKTLAEIYGYDKLFSELDKKSYFYDNNILYPK